MFPSSRPRAAIFPSRPPPAAGLSAEQRLLAALRVDAAWLDDDEARRGLARLHAAVDEKRTVALARREGVDGLLYAHLSRANLLDRLGPAARDMLAGRYRETAALNLRRTADVAELAEAFEQRDVEVVAIKGISLLHALYPDFGVRPMGDVDLWAPGAALGRVHAAIEAKGYRADPFYRRTYRREATTIDLHTHLLGAERVGARAEILSGGQAPWLAATRPSVFGRSIRRLGAAQEICFLALHVLKHNGERMLWLHELNELARTAGATTWDATIELAERAGQIRTLARVAYLIGNTVGEQVAEGFRDPRLEGALSRFDRMVLARRARTGRLPAWGPLVFFAAQGGIGARVAGVFETLFPRPEILRQIFQDRRTSLWRLYFRRIGHLVARAIR